MDISLGAGMNRPAQSRPQRRHGFYSLTQLAQELGIHPATLTKRMNAMGIEARYRDPRDSRKRLVSYEDAAPLFETGIYVKDNENGN